MARAALGKWGRADVRAVMSEWQKHLVALRVELLEGTWRPGGFSRFVIHEPKERVIHAPRFLDRVVHHALVDAAMPDFERWLIPDSYACRRGRGQLAALRRAEHYARRNEWFLKLDVARYFDSIPQDRLLAALDSRFRDHGVRALWRRIVGGYSTSPGRGIPIGSLTSQMLGNFYLMPVDRLCREGLRVSGYVRYMDDMALWGSRASMRAARTEVDEALSVLGLRLKPSWHLQPTGRGMEFLGMRVFPDGSVLTRRRRRRFVADLCSQEHAWMQGRLGDAAWQRSLSSLISHVRMAGKEGILRKLFREPGSAAIGLQPRESRGQLEQRPQELSGGQPEQE